MWRTIADSSLYCLVRAAFEFPLLPFASSHSSFLASKSLVHIKKINKSRFHCCLATGGGRNDLLLGKTL